MTPEEQAENYERQLKQWDIDNKRNIWKWRFGFACQIAEVSMLIYLAFFK